MPTLEALSLRFACDQSSRSSMPNIGTEDSVIIYKGNPVLIQASVFTGSPTAGTFLSDFSNVSGASLLIRKNNSHGDVLVEKLLDPDEINTALTYAEWIAGSGEQLLFELSDVDTNQNVPSDKTLDIYGVISLSTSNGPVTVGIFEGVIKDDGTGNPGQPVVPNYTSYSRAEIDTMFANLAPAQGLGNVTGPNGSVMHNIATYGSTSGQVIEDSGVALSALALVAATVDLATNQNVAGVKTFSSSPVVPDVTVLDATGKVANTNFVTSAVATLSATLVASIATKQASDATLSAFAGVTTAADKLIYATGVDAFATSTLSSFARTLLDDADAPTMRATLGVGSGSGDVATGFTTSVDSEIALFSGVGGKTLKRATGTGIATLASGVLSSITDSSANWNTAYSERHQWDGGLTNLNAATARTSLGLVIGTNVQAYDVDLDNLAGVSNTSFGRGFLPLADPAAARSYIGAGTGGGDASTNTTTSLDGELAVFSSTTGKIFRRISTPTIRGLLNEIWVSVRTDGIGKGTPEDPFDASGSDGTKLTNILTTYQPNYTIHYAPGTYFCKGWRAGVRKTMGDNCKHRGAGISQTIIKLVGAANGSNDGVIFGSDGNVRVDGFEASDMTLDCDAANQPSWIATGGAEIGAVFTLGSDNKLLRLKVIHFGTSDPASESFPIFICSQSQAGTFQNNLIEDCEVSTPVSGNLQTCSTIGNTSVSQGSTISRNNVIRGCRVDMTGSDFTITNGPAAEVVEGCFVKGVTYGSYVEPAYTHFPFTIRHTHFENCTLGFKGSAHTGSSQLGIFILDNEYVDCGYLQVDSDLDESNYRNVVITGNTHRKSDGTLYTGAPIISIRRADNATVKNNILNGNDAHGFGVISFNSDTTVASVGENRDSNDNLVTFYKGGSYRSQKKLVATLSDLSGASLSASNVFSGTYNQFQGYIWVGGGTPSGGGAGEIISRTGSTTGIVRFGDVAGNRYLYNDGSNYNFGVAGGSIIPSADNSINLGSPAPQRFVRLYMTHGVVSDQFTVNALLYADSNKETQSVTVSSPLSFSSGTLSLGTVGTTLGGTNITSYTLGDTLYSSASNTLAKLSGNTTTTKKFLTQTGNGTISAAPTWDAVVDDTAFASSWNGVATIAPSKNAAYDALTLLASDPSGFPGFSAPAWSISLGLDDFEGDPTTAGSFSASSWRTGLALTTLATTAPGTGVVTALSVNVGSSGAFVTNGGALGTPSSGTVTNLTGTASININGTVGATTPAAGTFTTVTSPIIKPSSDSTTAVKVTKSDGSTAVGTWDTTNSRLGIGVTPTNPLTVSASVGSFGYSAKIINTANDQTFTNPLGLFATSLSTGKRVGFDLAGPSTSAGDGTTWAFSYVGSGSNSNAAEIWFFADASPAFSVTRLGNGSFLNSLTAPTGTFSATTSLLLGTAGSAVGNIGFRNATSGTATLAPPTGALGTYTVTLPNAASTIPIASQQITWAGPTAARTYTLPDAAATLARTDAGNTFAGAQTLNQSADTSGGGLLLFNSAANRSLRFWVDGSTDIRHIQGQSGATGTIGINDQSSGPVTIGTGLFSTGGNVSIGGTLAVTGAVTQTAKTTTYNNIVTEGNGLGAIVKATRVTAQAAANSSIATYTTPASDGSYLISGNINVTAAIAISTSLNCDYTDETNTARTMIIPISGLAGTFVAGGLATSTGPFESAVMHIRTKASTAITIYTAAGTFTSATYNAEGIIRQLQ